VRTALEKQLASDFTKQKLFGQAAQFDNFDYKPVLKGAIETKESALAELFRYCERTTLFGAGAEEHAYILKLLLQHWGDEAFAKVLRVQSAEARQKVIWDLDYAYVEDFKKRFPSTYGLAKHGARFRSNVPKFTNLNSSVIQLRDDMCSSPSL
jgi:hypothetical protein